MIEQLIEDVLASEGIESYYLTRPAELKENAVYSYTMKPISHADNQLQAYEYSIIINIYVKLGRDISTIRDNVVKAMTLNGFKIKAIPSPNIEKDFVNIALQFKIAKFIERR